MTYRAVSLITNWVEICMAVIKDVGEDGLCILQQHVFL